MSILISFEGCEGVGKTTQVKSLKNNLLNSNYNVQIVYDPGTTLLGEYLTEERYPNSQVTPSDFSMKVLEHNLGGTLYLDDLELYFERSWVYHNKIEDERTQGYRFYFSSYFSISDYGILYEYKDYHTPYYFSVYYTIV